MVALVRTVAYLGLEARAVEVQCQVAAGMPRFNLTGEGFEFGRSIGPYGETAFLEVLTAAARLKVLTPVEERMAYAFSSRIAGRAMGWRTCAMLWRGARGGA